MTSEELESATSDFVRKTRSSLGSSAQSTGEEESMNEMRQDSRHASTTERQQRRRTVSFRNEETRTKRRRAVSQRPIFRAQSIDPKADRAIVADSVDFVVSASSKGCVSLVSKIAELLKYKLSLEQKVISLSKELQTYKSQPRSSAPITLKSEASRLTKPSPNETKVEKCDINCELLLPGVVPYPDTTSTNGNSLTHPPTITVSQFQDKGFGKENGICSQISPTNESFRIRKSCSDSETQTASEITRKPEMIDRGCSPIPQVDLENKFEEQINLVLSEKQFQKKDKTCQDIKTQTECDVISRKDKLIERGCSPDLALETVTPLQQLQPKKSLNKTKVYPSISNKKHKCETLKGAGDLHIGYLPATKSRPSSALSVTDRSSKSFPGVKNKHDKCPCSTWKMQRNGLPRLNRK